MASVQIYVFPKAKKYWGFVSSCIKAMRSSISTFNESAHIKVTKIITLQCY